MKCKGKLYNQNLDKTVDILRPRKIYSEVKESIHILIVYSYINFHYIDFKFCTASKFVQITQCIDGNKMHFQKL